VDVVTVEIEHVECDALDAIVASGKPVHPSPQAIRIIQDKCASVTIIVCLDSIR
jgi:phosphoribosylaminoimidazole carboxylase (NCAIR synthetase)